MRQKTWVKHVSQKYMLLFYLTLAAAVFYVVWRFLFTLPMRFGTVSILFGTLLLLSEGMTIFETFSHFNNSLKVRIPEMPVLEPEEYPTIDVLICTHNEEKSLLFKTIAGALNMDYPVPFNVYVCDDRNRSEIKQLAQRLGASYIGMTGNQQAKAGNLNHALAQTKGDYLAIFDADMIPRKNFLVELVPYFFLDRKIYDEKIERWRERREEEPYEEKPIAYVQSRQAFYNQDIFQRNLELKDFITNEQDYFYQEVNVSRMHTDSSAFAGSNTLFDRRAIEEIGGFATFSITEDLATSIVLAGKGYRGLALDKELAHGLSPDTVDEYLKQRTRWSEGSGQVIMSSEFWKAKIPSRTKVNYFISYLYWWTFFRRFIFIICPILAGLFQVHIADISLVKLLVIWVPYFIFYNYSLQKLSRGRQNAFLTAVIDTIQMPFLIKPIAKSTFKLSNDTFNVTGKGQVDGRNSSPKYMITHMLLSVLSFAAILAIFIRGFSHETNDVIVLFWLCYNALALLYALVFYWGVEVDHKKEFFPIEQSGLLENRKVNIKGMSDRYLFIEKESTDEEQISPRSSRGEVQVVFDTIRCQVCLDEQQGGLSRYKIKKIDQSDHMRYIALLYDRGHDFSRVINYGYFRSMAYFIQTMRIRWEKKSISVRKWRGKRETQTGK